MSDKLDKKLLDQLKDEVIKKDRQMEQKEYHNATKEALAEMTSLSKKEVDAMYQKIKAEHDAKLRKQRKLMIWGGIILIVSLFVAVPVVKEMMREPAKFVETFDDNSSLWTFSEKSGTGHYLTDGKFVIDSHKEKAKIEYIDDVVNFPENFTIEVDAVKESGDVDSYGFYIGKDANTFGYFFIRSNGKARAGFCVNGDWQDNPDWEESPAVKKGEGVVNRLKVEYKGDKFIFYVNDIKVREGSNYKIQNTQFSLACGGTQKISFDNLIIINTDTNEKIYENTFDKEKAPWTEQSSIIKRAEFKNGQYEILVNKDNYCYWASTWIPEGFADKDYEIKLEAEILEREGDGIFGFMLQETDKHYFSFVVKNGDKAKAQVVSSSEYVYNGTLTEFPKKGNTIELKIRKADGKMEYFVNNRLIYKFKKDEWIYWGDLEHMSLRVCDHQKVAFKNLTITEIK